MTTPETIARDAPSGRSALRRVDCDVHPLMRSREQLKHYLPRRYHPLVDEVAGRELYLPVTVGARQTRSFHREDTFPPSGGPPGSDRAFLTEQLIEPFRISHAILGALDHVGMPAHGDFGLAITAAINDWLRDEWLDQDPRLYGSIVVPAEDPPRAAAEIHRVARDERFVQVLLLVPTPDPLGHSRYWPIHEAAAEHGLPIALHPGGFSGGITGAGFPTYFLEFHVGLPFAYATEVVSLVQSGIFDRLPDLQVVLQEGAISWMVPLMARLDRAFEERRQRVPGLTERPSDVIRRHVWFTTQPLEEPDDPTHLLDVLGELAMDDRIMFASDYPHWDFDSPDRTLPPTIPAPLRERIFRGNAKALYGFDVDV